ncbi:hypothetical protein ABZW18_17885 [Streptomyces sp. NPDC004647]|uniref:hypothetical protein n=1 Tax=Streptomyces sp. NPDC004647 TaxID=3154671 RepID=UPI0033B8221E
MSVTVPAAARPPSVSSELPAPGFTDLLRSEWTKIRTVRTTLLCLLSLITPVLGVATLIALDKEPPGPHPIAWVVNVSHFGLLVGQLAVVVFAVTAIGSEYGTGLIRTSLAAVPWRGRWLVAKALVVAVLTLVAGGLLSVAAFAVVHSTTPDVAGSVLEPGVIRAVLGSGLYLSGLAVLSLAVGALVRNTAGGIAAMFALIFVVPVIVAASPLIRLGRFLPVGSGPPSSGWAITQLGPMLGGLTPWAGFAVLCAWAGLAMAGAVHLLRVRDA